MVGSTYDVVILSSSPPAAAPQREPPSCRVATPASSPLSFSPLASPLRTTSGASTATSRAAPIPEGAVRGFATVGSLIRSEHFTNRSDDELTKVQQAHSRRSEATVAESIETVEKAQKRSTKKASTTVDESEKFKSKPRARKPKPKSGKEIPDSDDELRRPQRFTKSPFFGEQPSESADKAPSETGDTPKLTKSGKPRKPRAKKHKAEEEGIEPTTKPKRTRVTKPKTTAIKGDNGHSNDAPVVSTDFQTGFEKDEESTPRLNQTSTEKQDSVDEQNASIWDVPQSPQLRKATARKQRLQPPVAEELGLDQAVPRRRDWTPPHDTMTHSPVADSTEKKNRTSLDGDKDRFTNLLSNFAYSESHPAQIAVREAHTTGGILAATKRRRVELIEIPGNQTNSRDSSPEKSKAAKKKPRTITDLVTGQYGPRDEESNTNIAKNFFEARTSTTTVPLNETVMPDSNAPPKKQPRKRGSPKALAEKAEPKAKAKSKKPSTKSAAKSKPVAEKLLSPAAAMLRLDQQDILFGTSSQLALEESPTMIRQIQFAIKESEQDADGTDGYSLLPPPAWSRLTKIQGKRGLWAASARDDEGDMLEHTRDVHIPEPDRTQDIPLLMDGNCDKNADAQGKLPGPLSFVDVDDIPPERSSPIAISSDIPNPLHTTPKASQLLGSSKNEYHADNLEFKDIDTFEQDPPPSNQKADFPHTFVDIDDFDLPPSAQIQYSPATTLKSPTYGSTIRDRSPKNRGRQPESPGTLSKVSAFSAPMPRPSSSESSVKPKEKIVAPSTPLKASSRFIDIEEILDSEDEALEALSPTPPRVQKIIHSEPLPLVSLSPTTSPSTTNIGARTKSKDAVLSDPNLAPVRCIPTKLLQWANIKSNVFAQITTHIRSLSPTTNPAKPTWHEKILMYDPIVLEDFTAYLNTSTSIRVFKKATQKQVKAWNQQRRVDGKPALVVEKGKDGKADGEDVLVVERELEAYMVQGWCESLSICCIWGEGRGKPGARKGFY